MHARIEYRRRANPAVGQIRIADTGLILAARRAGSQLAASLRGASLRPLPPVESKDPNTRYFHIHEDDQLDEELVASWIRQASERPGDPLF